MVKISKDGNFAYVATLDDLPNALLSLWDAAQSASKTRN